MKSTGATPSYETSEIGNPLDYSSDIYRVYFEVGEHEEIAKKIIQNYLGPERSKALISLPHGYEVEVAIQCVPDIIAALARGNIGIYQVIRYAKTKGIWE